MIGVGEKIHRQELTALGRGGTFLSNNPKAFKEGFKEIAQKLTATTDGRYVFSYCSPKRKGNHKVGGRGGDVQGSRPPDVQVQRRRLHVGLHAQDEAGPRAPAKKKEVTAAREDDES